MISFKKYKEGFFSISDISEKLISKTPIENFYIYSNYELTYQALKEFNFKGLERTEKSVNIYAQKVLDITGFFKKVDNPIFYFVQVFLNLWPNLLAVKNQIEIETKKHLNQIEELLKFYDSIPFIQCYKIKPSIPRNNEERKQLEFYKRTLLKKDEIVS